MSDVSCLAPKSSNSLRWLSKMVTILGTILDDFTAATTHNTYQTRKKSPKKCTPFVVPFIILGGCRRQFFYSFWRSFGASFSAILFAVTFSALYSLFSLFNVHFKLAFLHRFYLYSSPAVLFLVGYLFVLVFRSFSLFFGVSLAV